jgi:hypothetical protein
MGQTRHLDLTTVFQNPQFLALIPLNRRPTGKDEIKPPALSQLDKRFCGRDRVVEIDLPRCFSVRVPKGRAAQCPVFNSALLRQGYVEVRKSTRYKPAPHRAAAASSHCMKENRP